MSKIFKFHNDVDTDQIIASQYSPAIRTLLSSFFNTEIKVFLASSGKSIPPAFIVFIAASRVHGS